ncbi:MAG: hypothetical protein DRI86_12700 [Bacteroidetes bacterium]|nr:MAG: hypothetical protein DRI86_12700 [Bacteroidota bacterium]
MKSSKHLIIAIFSIAVIMLTFSSCKKYEDGPLISLRSKTARLTGEWKIVETTSTEALIKELTFEFKKDGDFSMTVPYTYTGESFAVTVDGKWEWIDSKESLKIEVEDNETEWEILRLTNSEFWFKDEDNLEYKCEKD